MAQRRIQKPKFDGSDSRRDTYDDENDSFFNRAGGGSGDSLGTGGQSARKASRRADRTLGNIDDVLNDTANDAPSGFYNNGQGGGGSAPGESSFYGGGGYDDAAETETGGNGGGGSAGTAERSLTPGQVGAAEASADSGASGAGDGIPFKQEGNRRGFRLTRRQGIMAGVAGLLGGGGLFFGGLATGPFELIHLAQVLSHSFSKTESDSSDRTSHLFRYVTAYKEKNVGYTRVGYLDKKVMLSVVNDLAKTGITIETNKGNRPTSIGIDRNKIEQKFPETKSMSNEKFRSWLEGRLNVPGAKFTAATTQRGKITEYRLNVRSFKFASIKNLIKNGQIGLVGDGKTIAGLKLRAVGKFYGLGSLFHPFSRALAQKLNDRVTIAGEKRQAKKDAKAIAREETAARSANIDSKGAAVATKVKENVDEQKGGPAKAIAVVGSVIIAACIVHKTASEIPKLDYYRIVAPTAIQAASIVAQGGAAMAGGAEITAEQVGATVSSLTDAHGHTIWEGAGMQALSGEQPQDIGNGQVANDLPASYRQAYEQHSTAKTLDTAATAILDGISGGLVAGLISGTTLCNEFVQYGIAAVSVAAQGVAAFFSGGLSQVAITAAETGESFLVQKFLVGSAIQWIQNWFIKSNTGGKLADDAFSGPLGGNLLAFGARAAADQGAIGSGNLSLGNEKSTIISEADRQDEQQFRNENTFAKIFDAKDYRSLTGHLADSMKPSLYGNLASVFSSVQNMGTSLGSMLAGLTPKAVAASNSDSWTGDFNWGFPQYGIPDSMLNDPNLDDPIGNANNVGQYLSSNCVDEDGNIGPDKGACAGDYKDDHGKGITNRIKQCFGNDLTYDDSDKMWDVVPETNNDGIDPNDSPYIDQDCGSIQDAVASNDSDVSTTAKTASAKSCIGNSQPVNTPVDTAIVSRPAINKSRGCPQAEIAAASQSTSMWTRTVMFVNDTSTMKAISCYNGDDDQSCKDLGLDGGQSPASDTGGSTVNSKDAPSYCKDGSAQGGQKIVCSAWLFNDYGYNDPGHRGDADYLKGFLADVKTCVSGNYGSGCKYKKGTLLVDCSGLVDAAVYDGMGVDLKGAATGGYPGNPHLQKIDPSQATAGDIYWTSGHTEVIVSNDTTKKHFSTFGAHDVYSDVTKDISPSGYSWGQAGAVFRVVP